MLRKISALAVLLLLAAVFCVPVCAEEVVGIEITIEIGDVQRTGAYTGTLENGLPNGFGRFESQNAEGVAWYYEGGFKDGRFDGEGKSVWKNGGREEGVYRNGRLYNGKFWTDSGILKYETVNGETVRAKSFDTTLGVLIFILIIAIISVLICFAVLFGLLFRISASRMATPELLHSPPLVAQEKPGLLNKTVAVTDIFKGILCLYADRIEYITAKTVTPFMFSDIFKVRHQYKNIFAVVLYSGEKHGFIVKPETGMTEWIGLINRQMELHRLASPEDPCSAVSLQKKSIVNIHPVGSWKNKNGTLFLYNDRIEFIITKTRLMNPFTRQHLDRIEYNRQKAPLVIPLPQIRHAWADSSHAAHAKLDCLHIETHANDKHSIFMAPLGVAQEWACLINNQIALYRQTPPQ